MIFIWILLLQQILVDAFNMIEPLHLKKAWFSPDDCGKDRTVVESLHNSCFRRLKLGVMEPKNDDYDLLQRISVYNDTKVNSTIGSNRPTTNQRVYGGRDTENGQYPWTVRLAYGNHPSNSWCTGSIIHSRFILTAAHCLYDLGGKDIIYPYVGVDPPLPEQMPSVATEQFLIHPCYWVNVSGALPTNYSGPGWCPEMAIKDSQLFDVALIQLRNNLTDSSGRWPLHDASQENNTYYKYNSVCLAEDGWPLDEHDIYHHSGWGLKKESADSPFADYTDRLQAIKYILKNMSYDGLHINFHNRLGHSACGGDSGSSIVVQNADGRYYQMSVAFSFDTEAEIPGIGLIQCSKSFARTVNIYYPLVKNWIWETIRNVTQRN